MLTTQHPQAEPVSKHQSEDEQQHVETLPMEDPTVLEVFESAEQVFEEEKQVMVVSPS